MRDKKQWYVWTVQCAADYGWGTVYDGLWGYEPRVYRTRSEACARRDELLRSGCWTDDDGNEQIPRFHVERMTIFRAVTDPYIEDEVRAIMPPSGTRVPARVLRDAAAECGVASTDHASASADLSGASSATHTHALLAGYWQQRGHDYMHMIGTGVVLR